MKTISRIMPYILGTGFALAFMVLTALIEYKSFRLLHSDAPVWTIWWHMLK